MRRRVACQLAVAAALLAPVAYTEPDPVWVWYRSSEGCPEGAAFIARLAELGQAARLASVGDRVDFVVTLGRVADTANSSGRLERQTRLGTVAIREYQDARCEQVAEALALTLDLALDPRAPEPSAAPPAAAAPAPPAAAAPAPPPLAESGSTTRAHTSAPTSAWKLGAQGLLETGVSPQPAFGGAAFAALDDPDGLVRQLRASLFVVHGQGQARDRELTVNLLGARLEACPLAWELPGVAFYPCAGVDLGALPLVKYEMGSAQGGEAWFRTRSLGLEAGLGVVWRGP